MSSVILFCTEDSSNTSTIHRAPYQNHIHTQTDLDDKLNLCRKYYVSVFALHPFLWFVNLLWFYKETFRRLPYGQQKFICTYMINSMTEIVVCIVAFVFFWVLFFQLLVVMLHELVFWCYVSALYYYDCLEICTWFHQVWNDLWWHYFSLNSLLFRLFYVCSFFSLKISECMVKYLNLCGCCVGPTSEKSDIAEQMCLSFSSDFFFYTCLLEFLFPIEQWVVVYAIFSSLLHPCKYC